MKNGSLIFNHQFIRESGSKDRVVKSYRDIKKFTEHCKGLGLKVVLTQGSWDMVHIGHARYLEAAKKHGDVLIVGVDSDAKIKKRKGPDRPIVPQHERLEMLAHLRPVDVIVIKEHSDPKWSLIKTVQPDVLIAIAETYSTKDVRDLKKHCKKVKVLPRQATTSTSAKIRKMQINFTKKLSEKLPKDAAKKMKEFLKLVK